MQQAAECRVKEAEDVERGENREKIGRGSRKRGSVKEITLNASTHA